MKYALLKASGQKIRNDTTDTIGLDLKLISTRNGKRGTGDCGDVIHLWGAATEKVVAPKEEKATLTQDFTSITNLSLAVRTESKGTAMLC